MDVTGGYEFFCPVRTVAGHQVLEHIPLLIDELGACRPMIMTDKDVAGSGLIETVAAAFAPGMTVGAVEDGVPPVPDVEAVRRIARSFRQGGCDAILAVGGGSVMHTAKGVNMVVSENADSLMPFAGTGKLRRRLKPLVAVPTTAGTGSEMSRVVVIADPERQREMVFSSPFLLPDAVVLDPRPTQRLAPAITAAGGMDALAHAVEAYTAMAKNPFRDAQALTAIELIGQNVLNVVKEPDNADGRLALAVAANLAAAAFSNAMVGMVHGLGHSVAAICGVPLGTCMAILLPYGLEYNLHQNGPLTARLLLPLAGTRIYAGTPSHLRARQTVSAIRELNRRLHQETGGRHAQAFKEIKGPGGDCQVPLEKLDAIAQRALEDGFPLCNPEEPDHDGLVKVMSHAWVGTALDGHLDNSVRTRIR